MWKITFYSVCEDLGSRRETDAHSVGFDDNKRYCGLQHNGSLVLWECKVIFIYIYIDL